MFVQSRNSKISASSKPGSQPESETKCLKLAILKYLSIQFFKGPQFPQILTTINMYLLIEISLKNFLNCHGNSYWAEKTSIICLKLAFQEITRKTLGCPEGWALRFWASIWRPDTLWLRLCINANEPIHAWGFHLIYRDFTCHRQICWSHPEDQNLSYLTYMLGMKLNKHILKSLVIWETNLPFFVLLLKENMPFII